MKTFRLKIRYRSEKKPYFLVCKFPLWTVDEAILDYLDSDTHKTHIIENDILEEITVEWGKVINGRFKKM